MRLSLPLSLPLAALFAAVSIIPPAVAAQGATGQAPSTERKADVVTVSGCLQQLPAVTGAPVGHESGAAAGILLTRAPASAGPGPSGSAPTPADSYLIAGTRAQELSRYVGEIVDVSGTLDSDVAVVGWRPASLATSSPKPVARHTITVLKFRATGVTCK